MLILSILYFAVGSTILAVGLGTVVLTVTVVSMFSLGVWYAHKSIRLGAELAIQAQNNNDQLDSVKMQSLDRFGGDVLKLKGQTGGDNNGYPLLEDTLDGSFTIQGIDD